jgi:hypothetical protein
MLRAVTPGDISEIMKLQVFLARKGDPIATREVLDRVVGRPATVTEIVTTSGADVSMTNLLPADDEARQMDATIPAVSDETRPLLRDEREGAA